SVSGNDEAFAAATTSFHLKLVRLGGNHTLAAVIGMLSEITTRHVQIGYRETRKADGETVPRRNEAALRAYEKVVSLVEEARADDAENFWRHHMARVLGMLESENGAAQTVVDVLE